jgi:hypothetical protein
MNAVRKDLPDAGRFRCIPFHSLKPPETGKPKVTLSRDGGIARFACRVEVDR